MPNRKDEEQPVSDQSAQSNAGASNIQGELFRTTVGFVPSPHAKPPTPTSAADSREDALRQLNESQVTFSRTPGEQAAFQRLLDALSRDFPLLESPLSGALDDRLRCITSNFTFTPQSGDEAFNPFHVEVLLDQAGNILDRAIRERGQYEAIAAEYFSLVSELLEFTALDAIHSEEEAAGAYDVERKRARSDYDAELLTKSMYGRCRSNADWYYNNFLTQPDRNAYAAAVQRSAWVAGLVPYYWEGQRWGGYTTNTFDGITETSAKHYFQSAVVTGWSQVWAQEMAVDNERITFEYSEQASGSRIVGLRARSNWEDLNSAFQRRRTVVSRSVLDAKLRAAVQEDGVLNSSRRLSAIRRRFELDFRNALARLKAAEVGLRSIFGYCEPLPSDQASIDYFDDCLAWARTASDWLIRFARHEQSFVLPISLLDVLGRRQFSNGRDAGQWLLPVSKHQFPDMNYVRLRGVLAFVEDCTTRPRLWRLRLTPPSSSQTHHGAGQTKELDQSHINPVVCSRAAPYDAMRDPDVNGTSTLMNASPFGDWTIELLGSSPSTEVLWPLDDVILHFIVAYSATERSVA